jgi:hypothetical protein
MRVPFVADWFIGRDLCDRMSLMRTIVRELNVYR